mmetsp:Transcript_5517/g.22885  ORF Transcript_5517/g.22885 Transcript_5517/m.22885 type:complete len:496 (+) Transcript_5517:482-1969(+)
MHPCGSYHYNALTSILREDFQNATRPARHLGSSPFDDEPRTQAADGASTTEATASWRAAAECAARGELRQVHRLDRLTSGVVIFAKTAGAARAFCEDIGAGRARKTYVARVRGRFPENAPRDKLRSLGLDATTRRARAGVAIRGAAAPPSGGETTPKAAEDDDDDRGRRPDRWQKGESAAARAARAADDSWRFVASATDDGDSDADVVEVDCGISCVDPKAGVYACAPLALDAAARPSRTRVRFVRAFADGTSLVECAPLTGRTHQIRLHLAYLGHPIANDPCYGGVLTAANAFQTNGHTGVAPGGGHPDDDAQDRGELTRAQKNGTTEPADNQDGVSRRAGESDGAFARRACRWCRGGVPERADAPHARFIWLHALRYAGPGWAYATRVPDWALDDDELEGANETRRRLDEDLARQLCYTGCGTKDGRVLLDDDTAGRRPDDVAESVVVDGTVGHDRPAGPSHRDDEAPPPKRRHSSSLGLVLTALFSDWWTRR